MLYHVIQHFGTLEEGEPTVFGLGGDVGVVLAVVTEGFVDLHHGPLLRQENIEKPVTAEPHVFVTVAFRREESIAPEDTLADVGDRIIDGEFLVYEVEPVVNVYVVAVRSVPEF